jgi:hypothetical protein
MIAGLDSTCSRMTERPHLNQATIETMTRTAGAS